MLIQWRLHNEGNCLNTSENVFDHALSKSVKPIPGTVVYHEAANSDALPLQQSIYLFHDDHDVIQQDSHAHITLRYL